MPISRAACVEFAAQYSWEASARVFIEHMPRLGPAAAGREVELLPEPGFVA
jgi:hypothetical protein